MANELTMQKALKDLLETLYQDYAVKIYQGKEIKNKDSKRVRAVPDLIIEHPFTFYNKSYKKEVMKTPIGIEMKSDPCQISKMAKGMVDQLKISYSKQEYVVEGRIIKTNSSLFTTPSLIKNGFLCKYQLVQNDYDCFSGNFAKHENFVIKRFAWAFNVGILLNNPYSEELQISYHNYLYDLYGHPRFGDTVPDPYYGGKREAYSWK